MGRNSDRLPLLDVLRGFALICIMLDHNHAGVLSSATLAKVAFFDAAELFVLLAGFLVGLLWSKIEASKGPQAAQRRFFKRSFEIYQSYLATALLVSALAAICLSLGLSQGVVWSGFGERLIGQPYELLWKTATFWAPPNLADILTIYVVLMLAAPLAMPLLRRYPLAFVALSLTLWTYAIPLNSLIPTGRPSGGLLFNPFGWQVIFFGGALLATFRRPIVQALAPHARALDVLAVAVVMAGAFYAIGRDWAAVGSTELWTDFRASLGKIDKWNVDIVRVTGLVAAIWLVARISSETAAALARTRTGEALATIGRQGMPCFVLGVALSVIGDASVRALAPSFGWTATGLAVDLSAIALMVCAAYVLEQGRGARAAEWGLTRIGANVADAVLAGAGKAAERMAAATREGAAAHRPFYARGAAPRGEAVSTPPPHEAAQGVTPLRTPA